MKRLKSFFKEYRVGVALLRLALGLPLAAVIIAGEKAEIALDWLDSRLPEARK